MSAMVQEIRQFIIDNFLFGDSERDFSNDDSFLEQGLIDSTGVLELVMFVETTYDITIEDHELIPANLDSVNSLVQFIDRKSWVST
jgi:acyl carrier protein